MASSNGKLLCTSATGTEQNDGPGSFGRKRQKVVVQALQAMLNSNDEIRDDESQDCLM